MYVILFSDLKSFSWSIWMQCGKVDKEAVNTSFEVEKKENILIQNWGAKSCDSRIISVVYYISVTEKIEPAARDIKYQDSFVRSDIDNSDEALVYARNILEMNFVTLGLDFRFYWVTLFLLQIQCKSVVLNFWKFSLVFCVCFFH